MSHDSHTHDGPHVVPLKTLVAVLIALLLLTGLTVVTGKMDLGGFDLAVALVIATVKATIVCLIFMHLFWDRRFNGLIFLFSVMLVGLFLAFVSLDAGEYQPSVEEYEIQELAE